MKLRFQPLHRGQRRTRLVIVHDTKVKVGIVLVRLERHSEVVRGWRGEGSGDGSDGANILRLIIAMFPVAGCFGRNLTSSLQNSASGN